MGSILKDRRIRFLVTVGLLLSVLISLCGDTVANEFIPVSLEKEQLLQVKVHQVFLEPERNVPVVILADPLEERGLLIWIGFLEANAISSEMQSISHRRPLTHDLLEKIILKANLRIQRVVITHIKEGIYYATILIEGGESLMEIDARPSDSIIMALKFRAPIYVSENLFRERSIPLAEPKEMEKDYGLTFQELTPSLAQVFSFGSKNGILVSDVRKGSRAEKDGIERGDIFVEAGERPIEDVMSMRDVLRKTKDAVQVKVFRKGHFMTITLHPK